MSDTAEIGRSRFSSLITVLAFQAEFKRTLVLMLGIASHLSTYLMLALVGITQPNSMQLIIYERQI